MYISDSNGNIVGIQDSEDHKRINLINPDLGEIKIKIDEANKYQFHYFAYLKNGQNKIIPMNLIIEDGIKKDGNYIYKFSK